MPRWPDIDGEHHNPDYANLRLTTVNNRCEPVADLKSVFRVSERGAICCASNMTPTELARIDYVILLCRDLKAARQFYLDVLGLSVVENHPVWVRLDLGETFLTLRPRGKWLSWQDARIPERVASVQLAFKVDYDDVNPWYQHFLHANVEVVEEPVDQDFGNRTFFVRDPDHNVIEFYAEIS